MIRKRTILFALCFLLLTAIPAYAIEAKSISVTPTLTFNGTTASCSVSVSSYGKSISVTLELWNGSTFVDSWSRDGVSVVTISEQCSVTKGKTYTLKVSGSVAGNPISGSVSKTCP